MHSRHPQSETGSTLTSRAGPAVTRIGHAPFANRSGTGERRTGRNGGPGWGRGGRAPVAPHPERMWPVWKLIGWSEIVGGAAGFLLLGMAILWPAQPQPLFNFVGGGFAFLASALAGVLLLRHHRWGTLLTFAVQAAQIFHIQRPDFSFSFFAGPQLMVRVAEGGIVLNAGVNASFWMGANMGPEPFMFAINFFPVIAVVYAATRATAPSRPTEPAHSGAMPGESIDGGGRDGRDHTDEMAESGLQSGDADTGAHGA